MTGVSLVEKEMLRPKGAPKRLSQTLFFVPQNNEKWRRQVVNMEPHEISLEEHQPIYKNNESHKAIKYFNQQ